MYRQEKLQVSLNSVAAIEQRKCDLKSVREDRQLLALKELFTKQEVTFFQNSNQCTFSAEELNRFWIVQNKIIGVNCTSFTAVFPCIFMWSFRGHIEQGLKQFPKRIGFCFKKNICGRRLLGDRGFIE